MAVRVMMTVSRMKAILRSIALDVEGVCDFGGDKNYQW